MNNEKVPKQIVIAIS